MKKFTMLLFVIFTVFIGCSEKYSLSDPKDYYELDNILIKQKYNYSVDPLYKNLSLVKYNTKNLSTKEYKISNNSSLNLAMKKDEYFILSLPTNQTITYSWDIVNLNDLNIIKFEHKSKVHLNNKDKSEIGTSYDRENFYFSIPNSGSQHIEFEYLSSSYKSTDNFKFDINILVTGT